MKTLILSTSRNCHAESVQKELELIGKTTVRIDFDKIYSQQTIGLQDSYLIVDGEYQEINSVFVHHPSIEIDNFIGIDDIDKQLTKSQWSGLINNAPALLDQHVRWLNNPNAMKCSSSTTLQLRIAQNIGLKTPKTCITTDLKVLENFASINGRVILKPGNLPGLKLQNKRLLAHIINVHELTSDELRFAPCLFQEYIEKSFELRIHVIGDIVIACKIESQKGGGTEIDWRNYNLKDTPHSEYHLDLELCEKCIQVTKLLGYEFGIIDAIITPEGEFVFLECNSQGHWLWIEELTGLSITKTIASHLL